MSSLEALKSKLETLCPTLELRTEEPMEKHTSFRIGGPVKLMALPRTEEEGIAAVQAAAELGIEPLMVGNGSNLLVADEGLDAFVIKTVEGLSHIQDMGGNILRLEAGVILSRAAMAALDRGLTGLEFAHGIPGSVGGAVTMNAGAYFGEMADVVCSVRFLYLDGTPGELQGEQLGFSYRNSAFEHQKTLILSADVVLQAGDEEKARERMADLAIRRRERQPLEYPSAGSAFKRPKDGFAAALIDQCGLKGFQVGGAQVAEKHAGFIINRGGATCRDVQAVVAHVYRTVLRETGVALEPEVKLLGVDGWNL